MERTCTLRDCTGEYEERVIIHTVRYRGRPIVIDHGPAQVCGVCGDVLLAPDTIRRIELLLKMSTQPASTAPVYEFA